MNENEDKVLNEQQVEDMTPDYLEAIKQLKQNSVDRSDYDKLKAENKRLLDTVINGQPAEAEVVNVVPSKEEIQSLRNDLFNPKKDLSNLEYVEKSLKLREALMESGQPDPFIPVGKQISPTRDDIEIAEKVATVYQECVDYARGDSEAFTTELMRRTKDVRIR